MKGGGFQFAVFFFALPSRRLTYVKLVQGGLKEKKRKMKGKETFFQGRAAFFPLAAAFLQKQSWRQ